MTIEEVWKHIIILKNKTTDSAALDIALIFAVCALMPMFIILSGMAGFNIDCFDGIALVLASAVFILPTIISFAIYAHRPKKIRLHISVDHSISVKQLTKFFKISKVLQENSTIICNLKPKNKYYYDVVDLMDPEK